MPPADRLTVLHDGVVAVFVGAAALMLAAIGMRLCIRRPLMVWQNGPRTYGPRREEDFRSGCSTRGMPSGP